MFEFSLSKPGRGIPGKGKFNAEDAKLSFALCASYVCCVLCVATTSSALKIFFFSCIIAWFPYQPSMIPGTSTAASTI
jgi:hypothetical protein